MVIIRKLFAENRRKLRECQEPSSAFFGYPSGVLRLAVEEVSNNSRTAVEAFSKQSRTSVEEQSKSSRTAVEEIALKSLTCGHSAPEHHRETLSLAPHILLVDHRDRTGLDCILIEV